PRDWCRRWLDVFPEHVCLPEQLCVAYAIVEWRSRREWRLGISVQKTVVRTIQRIARTARVWACWSGSGTIRRQLGGIRKTVLIAHFNHNRKTIWNAASTPRNYLKRIGRRVRQK